MLNNKTVLIAGAGGLIGRSVVKTCLAQGAAVIASDLDIANLQKRLQDDGVVTDNSKLTLATLNIQDADAIQALLLKYQPDGAVNCSYPRNKSYGKHFFDVSLQSFNDNLSLNLGSAFLFMQQCAAYFKQQPREFSLVNLASVYGVVAPRFDVYANTSMTMPVEYVAIKSALIHLSKYTAAYVADSRFRVNLVSPGGILDGQAEPFLQKYQAKTLGKGMLDAADVTGAIAFLLSDHARFTNGQNIVVDDGFTLCG
ncbi:MAG: flagellin modification protein A [Gammaproteobacteria bacterium]|nr:flagellin modification protein A [Gammaproteobacteria bacterium]MBU1554126.1 flagellin modification protein A [Gammaproteobacteria bacterium]MBU2069578.1 flagellin modification protein A [Gammaproteobacteria bacterium]MBU2184443.1 flagellin modification protein A [Gammaproteobacteria bacterium]MBU2205746.1 flagellin modification protein A [Gammaproteobacteria bacterium]